MSLNIQIAYECASKTNCNFIVDIGSGMGHLARLLAFKYDLKVACIEQNEQLLQGARYNNPLLFISKYLQTKAFKTSTMCNITV